MTLANTEQKIQNKTMTNPDGSEFTAMTLRGHEDVFAVDQSGNKLMSIIAIFHVDDDSEYGCEDGSITIYNMPRYARNETTVEISYSSAGSNTKTIEDAEKRIRGMQFAVALAKLL